MIKKMILLCKNREVISYLIAGVLTTLINIVVFDKLCNQMHIPDLTANTAAFVISVLFAFFVNDRYVFQGRDKTFGFTKRIATFFSARVVSFFIDSAGMYFFVQCLGVNNMVVKVGMNGVVIVLNYVFSKWFIFK